MCVTVCVCERGFLQVVYYSVFFVQSQIICFWCLFYYVSCVCVWRDVNRMQLGMKQLGDYCVMTVPLTYASNKSLIWRQLISLVPSEVIFAVGIDNILQRRNIKYTGQLLLGSLALLPTQPKLWSGHNPTATPCYKQIFISTSDMKVTEFCSFTSYRASLWLVAPIMFWSNSWTLW